VIWVDREVRCRKARENGQAALEHDDEPLLDEILVHVAPVLVGDGVRLFDRPGGVPVKLQRISSMDEGQTTVLRYRTRIAHRS
jgi:riboflavin biosynthesis pyrimidine reductase